MADKEGYMSSVTGFSDIKVPSTISAEQLPVYRVNLSFVPSEISPQPAPAKAESTNHFITKEKVVQIAAYSLILLGALFLTVSMALFTTSFVVGAGTASAMLGETVYPLGILSLIAGINLFEDQKNSGLKISSRLGPMTLTI